MIVTPVKTKVVRAFEQTLTEFLDESLINLHENCVLAITSKVVSLCEGNVVSAQSNDKDKLIESEADYFLPKSSSYDVYLTIKDNIIIPSSGIDESNTNGYFVLWPEKPYETARICWDYIKKKFNLNNFGIIITDSTPVPMRWGVTGKAIAFCGFKAVNNLVGNKDLFGRNLKMTQINVADALAAAAVLCMGESDEQTPLAVIEDMPCTEFRCDPPSEKEIESYKIDIKDDLFGPLLNSVNWQIK